MKAFLFSAVCSAFSTSFAALFAPFNKIGCTSAIQVNLIALSLHYLWLLQSLRRESLSHKVANPDFQRSKAWRTAFPALCVSFLCCYLGSLLHRPMQCLWTNRLFIRHPNDKYSYMMKGKDYEQYQEVLKEIHESRNSDSEEE